MLDSIREYLKKILRWTAVALGVCGAAVCIGSLGKRYAAARSELGRLRAEVDRASGELQKLREQQSIAAGTGAQLERALREQSAVLDSVAGQLGKDERILRDSEQKLGEAGQLIDATRRLLAKYTAKADVEQDR